MDEIMVTDFTVDGKCSNCGNCCSNCLPLSNAEITRIRAYIKKHNIKEQRHNVATGVDMTCPFRDEGNKKCLIYEIRPAICRKFKCDYTKQDLLKTREDSHKINRVVFMRTEFFGNKEDILWFQKMMLGGEFN